MKTTSSVVAMIGMSMAFSAAVAGVSQDRIPELRRDAGEHGPNTTMTGCVARGAVTGTYILTNSAKDGEAIAVDATPRAMVVLSGADIDMSRHIGASVSVTGSYAREWVRPFAAAEKSAPGDGANDPGRKTPRTFTVKSLKVIAASCSQPAE